MKTVLIALLSFGLTTIAQPRHHGPEFTPEQQKNLRVKELTLALDLNDSQQKQMASLIDRQQTLHRKISDQRKATVKSEQKPTADQAYQMRAEVLDEKIAIAQQAKKFLDKEQFQKWQGLQHRDGKKKEFRKNRQPKGRHTE